MVEIQQHNVILGQELTKLANHFDYPQILAYIQKI